MRKAYSMRGRYQFKDDWSEQPDYEIASFDLKTNKSILWARQKLQSQRNQRNGLRVFFFPGENGTLELAWQFLQNLRQAKNLLKRRANSIRVVISERWFDMDIAHFTNSQMQVTKGAANFSVSPEIVNKWSCLAIWATFHTEQEDLLNMNQSSRKNPNDKCGYEALG